MYIYTIDMILIMNSSKLPYFNLDCCVDWKKPAPGGFEANFSGLEALDWKSDERPILTAWYGHDFQVISKWYKWYLIHVIWTWFVLDN